MLRSYFSALTGLSANALSLGVIGNNLANVNSIAYKVDRALFQDQLYSLIGTSPSGLAQVGLGTKLGSVQTLFTQGSLQNTGVATDIAIQGNGFFVVSDGVNRFYTRAGNFTLDSNGNLVNPQGLIVQGYPAVDGKINLQTPITNINIKPGVTSAPIATTLIKIVGNLDSNAAAGAVFTTSVQIYDSLGAAHTITFTFTKASGAAGDPPAYNFDITIDGAKVQNGTAGKAYSLLTGADADPANPPGKITFSASGKIDKIEGVTTVSANDFDIQFPPSDTRLANGAVLKSKQITWDIDNSPNEDAANSTFNITGFAGSSVVSSVSQNGSASGTLNSIYVTQDGLIQGVFSNGVLTLGQIVMANFNNPDGLVRFGDNLFQESSYSGQPTFSTPGKGGLGTLSSGALELANVDIAQEFTSMILAQRGYQASSRVIAASDQVIQETLNLIR